MMSSSKLDREIIRLHVEDNLFLLNVQTTHGKLAINFHLTKYIGNKNTLLGKLWL